MQARSSASTLGGMSRKSAYKGISSWSFTILLIRECLHQVLLLQFSCWGRCLIEFGFRKSATRGMTTWSFASAIKFCFSGNVMSKFCLSSSAQRECLQDFSSPFAIPQLCSAGNVFTYFCNSAALISAVVGNVFMKFCFCNSALKGMSARNYAFAILL